MYGKLDTTDFDLQQESKLHDEFLKTLEEDLEDLRRDLAKLNKVKKASSKKRSGLGILDLKDLGKEVNALRSVILDRSETNRMLHTRLRDEINRCIYNIGGRVKEGKFAESSISDYSLSGKSKDLLIEKIRDLLEREEKWTTKTGEAVKTELLRKEKEANLERLIEDFRKSEWDKTLKILRDGGLKGEEEAEQVFQFYIHYAVYTEYFNSMKYLYQILLKEYEELDILDDNVVTELRKKAIFKITSLLCQHGWKKPGDARNRETFRNQLMIEIRKELHNATPIGLWPKDGSTHPRKKGSVEEAKMGVRRPISALCLSGGGIRSATFSLGVIQGLAKLGLLDKFHYLSTVSGGGYIGSWLSAWIYRERPHHRTTEKAFSEGRPEYGRPTELKRGVNIVQRKLVETEPGAAEPRQVTHLRSYSNYMTPRVGILSIDAWTLIGVYIQNLLLNWMVFVPLIAAFLLFPRIVAEFTSNGKTFIHELLSPTAVGLGVVGVVSGIVGLFFMNMYRPGLGKAFKGDSWFSEKFRRDEIGILKNVEPKIVYSCILPLVVSALCITTYWFCIEGKGDRWAKVRVFLAYVNDYDQSNDILSILICLLGVVTLIGLFSILRKQPGGQRDWDTLLLVVVCVIYLSILTSVLFSGFGSPEFVGTMIFAETLFATAFILSWGLIGFLGVKHKRSGPGPLSHLWIELGISFLAATSGGIILFMVARNFDIEYFYQSVQLLLGDDISKATIYTVVAVPIFISVLLITVTIFVGIGSKIMDNLEREWLSRLEAWLLIVAVGWFAVCGLVLLGPKLIEKAGTAFQTWFSLGSISGVVTLFFGYYANSLSGDATKPSGKISTLVRLAPRVAAPVFAMFLIVLVTIGTDALINFTGRQILNYDFHAQNNESGTGLVILLCWVVVLTAIGCLMGWWINANKFSLHATYRERLIRAYLGATRADDRINTANSFTGLDEHDDIEMRDLLQSPFHVINMTLNVAKTASLRWQTRKAESFTVTPFHCGSSNMGEGSGTYRKSEFYGSNKAGSPISLGTAAAISGAAASPNMGYYTQSTFVSALMALFNVRLGWWLGNPGRRGSKTYHKSCPDFSPRLFFDEAFGMTEDTNPYIYLSDGGHFDNLGLYEMVLRRCELIVLCDAAADAEFKFSDLGLAIHKIRVDMGIPIEFEPGDLPIKGRNCSIATIRYSAVDGNVRERDGILIYIKPTLDGHEPVDIIHYANTSPNFPHESTFDQMFGETQFESYRSLACHMINSICGKDEVLACKLCEGVCDKPDDHITLRNFYDLASLYLENFGKKTKTGQMRRSTANQKRSEQGSSEKRPQRGTKNV